MHTDTLIAPRSDSLSERIHQAQISLESRPDAAAVFDRATTAFMRALLSLRDELSAAGRDRRLLAQDDKTLLAELLIQALRADPLVSKELRLRLRGQLALRSLLEQSGGALTAAEVAELLGITEDAVRKRARRGKLLALASLLFLLAALGQGILISTVTNSQQVAYFAAALSSILPALLLSDFVFPISGMPKAIQAVTMIVPAKYYVHLLRGIMMRGAGFAAGASDLAALALFSAFTLVVAAVRLKKARLV